MSNDIKAARTYNLTIWRCMDGAVVSTHSLTLSITRYTDGTARCERDGVEISEAQAIGYAQSAQLDGRMVLISEYVAAVAPAGIGKTAGHMLHLELARLEFGNGLAFASEILGRPVDHFRTLTADEARSVRSAAYGSWGLVG